MAPPPVEAEAFSDSVLSVIVTVPELKMPPPPPPNPLAIYALFWVKVQWLTSNVPEFKMPLPLIALITLCPPVIVRYERVTWAPLVISNTRNGTDHLNPGKGAVARIVTGALASALMLRFSFSKSSPWDSTMGVLVRAGKMLIVS